MEEARGSEGRGEAEASEDSTYAQARVVYAVCDTPFSRQRVEESWHLRHFMSPKPSLCQVVWHTTAMR